MFNVSLDKAADIYYSSETANMVEEGVADLHCRSDKYLAGEVWREYQESCSWTFSSNNARLFFVKGRLLRNKGRLFTKRRFVVFDTAFHCPWNAVS